MTLLLAITALAAAGIAWLALGPWLRGRRRAREAALPLPPEWREELARWPLYRRVPADLRVRLDGLVRIFVAEKRFVGCGGLEVTQAMRLAVALHACLLLLNRGLRVYDGLRSVLLYPDEFVVDEEFEEDGVITQASRPLAGQAWDSTRIILSWRDVEDAGDGYNVVIHEFAHWLDEEAGDADGVPLLGSRREHEEWAAVMQRAYAELVTRADAGHDTLLDPYGAEHESEFYAVATETFFELPEELAEQDPELYAQLVRLYGVDPARWPAAA